MTHSVCRSGPKRALKNPRGRALAPFVLTILVVAGALLSNLLLGRLIIFNDSPSVALGFYVTVHQQPAVGCLVEFRLPASGVDPVHRSHDRIILKPIAAGPGDQIDTTGAWLWINGRRIAAIYTTDSNGHALPVWRANRQLAHDEYYLLSLRVWNSYDSRSYGPVRRADIVAVRRPLWTWNDNAEGINEAPESSQVGRNP